MRLKVTLLSALVNLVLVTANTTTRASVVTVTATAHSSASALGSASASLSYSLGNSSVRATLSPAPSASTLPGPSGYSILGCHPEMTPSRLLEETVTKESGRFITRRSYNDGSFVIIDENGGKSLKITTISCADGSTQVATEYGDRAETSRVTESPARGLRVVETERQGQLVGRAVVDLHPAPPTITTSQAPVATDPTFVTVGTLPAATFVQAVDGPLNNSAGFLRPPAIFGFILRLRLFSW